MTEFLATVGGVATQVLAWTGDVCETIVSEPLLLFTTGFLAVGGAIGIVGRLLSKR